MRAAVIDEVGVPPAVRDGLAEPRRETGEVLLDVAAVALNPVELHIWRGAYRDGPPRVPYVPGIEGVGTVVTGGVQPPGTRVRFEVAGLHPGYGRDGALAERAVAPADAVTLLPPEVDDGVAAALGASGITALRVLEAGGAGAGAAVLVLGATGMVGRLAVQLARVLGAGRVVAAGRDVERLERAVALGAHAAVPLDGRPRAELTAQLREASGGDGFDVIVDPLWGEPALAALEAAARDVVHVNIGRAAGDPVALPHALLLSRRATLRGLSTAMDPPPVRAAAYGRLLEHVRAGRLVVDHDVVPLDEIAAAWERQSRSPGRKLVVRVR